MKNMRKKSGQFSVLVRKNGADCTLSVNPVRILGEPVLSITPLKIRLCRQRFLRMCPLYFYGSARKPRNGCCKLHGGGICGRGNCGRCDGGGVCGGLCQRNLIEEDSPLTD